jgi:hypothetical protein
LIAVKPAFPMIALLQRLHAGESAVEKEILLGLRDVVNAADRHFRVRFRFGAKGAATLTRRNIQQSCRNLNVIDAVELVIFGTINHNE